MSNRIFLFKKVKTDIKLQKMKAKQWVKRMILSVSGLIFCITGFSQDTLSYADLVHRLTDMEYLATPPLDSEKSGTFTSYDRNAKYDAAADRYVNWQANGDGTGFIRKEGTSIVAFEADGPGVIWRVWSALAKYGHIRIFIDHQEVPVVDRPFIEFFTEFAEAGARKKQTSRMNFPSLVNQISRGRNSWIPIPFNKHCKILLDENWGAYYHFTYSTFSKNTRLPEFLGTFDVNACVALAEADRQLYLRGRSRELMENEKKQTYEVTVPAKSAATICNYRHAGAITHMVVTPSTNQPGEIPQMLRDLAIRISWDNEKIAGVWSPLGDFFGTAPGINPYEGYPLGMSETSFYSRWYMPFGSARLELVNDGNKPRKVKFQITTVPLKKQADQLLRFHAKFHNGLFMEEIRVKGKEIEWPLLVSKGEGRFCGITFTVLNRWPKSDSETIYKTNRWWGEGDEKFYVDGEKFPSTFGTGSEDYFGHAWAANAPFPMYASPFASQPFIEIDANGYTSLNRFHIADNIPFKDSFTGTIEKFETNGKNKVDSFFECVAYWYQRAGQSDQYPEIPLKDRMIK